MYLQILKDVIFIHFSQLACHSRIFIFEISLIKNWLVVAGEPDTYEQLYLTLTRYDDKFN